jgi:hypothetical protein
MIKRSLDSMRDAFKEVAKLPKQTKEDAVVGVSS